MSRREWQTVTLVSVFAALTRFLAIARSPWDWDEANFALAVRDGYDIALHHPHPPGYPLLIAAADLVHRLGLDGFRSVQSISVAASLFVFPIVFWLARELGFASSTCLIGALFFTFLPNVWVFGGMAFSDIPAIVLGLAACALFLRGSVSSRAYIAGAILLAIACGIRPLTLLLAAAPALRATAVQWQRSRRTVLVAVTLSLAITGLSYGGAALLSGSPQEFGKAVAKQAAAFRDHDTLISATRIPLAAAATLTFLYPVRNRQLMTPIAMLATIAIVARVRKRGAVLWTMLTFLPMSIVTWLALDWTCIGRYAVAYMPMHALLAAEGLAVLGGVIARRSQGVARVFEVACALTLTLSLAAWTWPGIHEVRSSESPSSQAFHWVKEHTPPTVPIYVSSVYSPLAAYELTGRNYRLFQSTEELPRDNREFCIVAGGLLPKSIAFQRQREPLFFIVRPSRFELFALCR
jgi:hypothetical protein